MKRSAFDERRDAKIADDYLSSHSPCRWCGSSTERETLTALGARCVDCYRAYCSSGRPVVRLTPQGRSEAAHGLRSALSGMSSTSAGKAWAFRLRDREQDGDSLTQFQREAWRSALKSELQAQESAA